MDDANPDLTERRQFSTTDPDVVEEFIRGAYVENTLALDGDRHDFTFDHWSVAAPSFAIDRLRATVGMSFDAESDPGHPFLVNTPTRGRVTYSDSTTFDDTCADAGTTVLVPPSSRFRAVCENVDGAVVLVDRDAVAEHATAVTGLPPGQFMFESNLPVNDAMNGHWAATVAHIQDHILADPWAAAQPILIAQAFHSLAAALLATFPNTALSRTADPTAAGTGGTVPERTVRTVVDYLDAHADQPVGPADIAGLTGMPTDRVVHGVRDRHGRAPSEVLWAARLRGVRRELLDATDAPGTTVARLAAKWGFTHVERFRVIYRHEFDEWPEDTLKH